MDEGTYYSDKGKPCHACRGTIYRYDLSGETVQSICLSCKVASYFLIEEPRPETAKELSAIHRLS